MSDLISFLEADFVHNDERGFLYQLCHQDYQQVNVSKTLKGTFRGGHYHKATKEAFFIIEGALRAVLEKDGIKETYELKKRDFFLINPLVIHSFEFLDDTLMVALYDKPIENKDGTKDIYKKES